MKRTGTGLDLLLVNAPGKQRVYQSLASDLAAFEPPIWAGLIANLARHEGFRTEILDAEALLLTYDQTVEAIVERDPLLTVFVVYGQQPSASTQCMPAAGDVARLLKEQAPELRTMFMGTHASALPERTLREEATDFVVQGEGPHTILGTLRALQAGATDFRSIGGLWHKVDGRPMGNAPEPVIKELDTEFHGMAWDLLPMDRYRAHNWHCWEHIHDRGGYASIYTSLGCPYRCTFCCINAPFGGSSIRFFSPETMIREIDVLVQKYGVRNLKIADEMFVLNPKHVLGLADLLIERDYGLNIWAYARVDTVRDAFLEKLKKAGFHWLGIGVESASKFVRDGVDKGRFQDEQIAEVVARIRSHGINVGANYIFGLPDDTLESMEQTLQLAMSLNTEWANFYSAMAYPGSALHHMATEKGVMLPESPGGPGWIGYSQHAYECLPLPTDTVPAGQVLTFRDLAFDRYFAAPEYHEMLKAKFGEDVVEHVRFMAAHSLERKYALALPQTMAPM